MNASFNKIEHTLDLSLFFNRNIKDENGNDLDGGESDIVYKFIVSPDGHLLFKEIRMAG